MSDLGMFVLQATDRNAHCSINSLEGRLAEAQAAGPAADTSEAATAKGAAGEATPSMSTSTEPATNQASSQSAAEIKSLREKVSVSVRV